MIFDSPIPFTEAIAAAERRGLLPTSLGSAEIRGALDAATRRRAVFSARTTNASYLQTIKDTVEATLRPDGPLDVASAKARLQDQLDALGYDPEIGFPDTLEQVPPARRGGLQDLSSDRRAELIIQTQARMAFGIGRQVRGNDPLRREQFPAWELVRGRMVQAERGDWDARWRDAGGEFFGGRMIAAKDSPVWRRLGEVRDDGLGNPYPPFAFNSGMTWREVDREEAVRLGVVDEDFLPAGEDPQLDQDLNDIASQYDPEVLQSLRDQLDRDLEEFDAGDTLAREIAAAQESYAGRVANNDRGSSGEGPMLRGSDGRAVKNRLRGVLEALKAA